MKYGVKRDNYILQKSKVIILVRARLNPIKEGKLTTKDQQFGKEAKALQMDKSFTG